MSSVLILQQREFHYLLRQPNRDHAQRILLERNFRRAVILECDREPDGNYDSDASTATVKPEQIPYPKYCDLDEEVKRMRWRAETFKKFKVRM